MLWLQVKREQILTGSFQVPGVRAYILTVGQAGMVCESNRIGGRKQKPAGNQEEVLPVAS
jgi:hypothetical protein